MHIHVQTRGRTADYAFLGSAPDSRWWLDFRDVTSFENPTIIVSGGHDVRRVYVSGIRSQRTDRVGTAIRFTLVLEARYGDVADDALRLVSAWLSDATTGEMGSKVQAVLDESFDEAAVERFLSDRRGDIHSLDEVEGLAFSALQKLPAAALTGDSDFGSSWVGSANSARAREVFMAQAWEILGGQNNGTVALLNLVGTVDDVMPIAGRVGSLGVLMDVSSEYFGDALIELETTSDQPTTQPAPINDGSYDFPERITATTNPAILSDCLELNISGTWREGCGAVTSRRLRLTLRGNRIHLIPPRRPYSMSLTGTISVKGLYDDVEINGNLDLTAPEHGIDLTVNFMDSHGVSYRIVAKTRSLLTKVLNPTLNGRIWREERQVGDVKLHLIRDLVIQISPLLN